MYELRMATDKEIDFYEKKLYPLQDKVFEKVSNIFGKKLYLTGGTALARFYLFHRYSEDLDFFTTENNISEITDYLADELKNNYNTLIVKNDKWFGRIIIEDILKIEIVKEYHIIGDLIKTDKGIYVNSLEDIGTNKITAFEDRTALKDIIDLFYILKQIDIQKLFEYADIKRMPISYEDLLAFNTQELAGEVTLIKPIDNEELLNFIKDLKFKTEENVKKKEEMIDLDKEIKAYLWDFPLDRKIISKTSESLLINRLWQMPLPLKRVLARRLNVDLSTYTSRYAERLGIKHYK